MGCIHAGELSDLCYYYLVEMGYLLDPCVRQAFGIIAYYRFKDDVFIIFQTDGDTVQACIAAIQHRAKYFVVTEDKISSTSVDMLDITLSKTNSWIKSGLLHVSHFVKPSAIGKYLSSDSVHPSSTHMGWPLARVSHFKLCNTDIHGYYDSCVKFHNKLSRDSPGHVALQWFKRRFLGLDVFQKPFHEKVPCTYVAVPFSRVWNGAGLNRCLKSVYDDHAALISDFTDLPMLASIAWSKAQANLLQTLHTTWKRAYINGRRQG